MNGSLVSMSLQGSGVSSTLIQGLAGNLQVTLDGIQRVRSPMGAS